MRKTKLCTGLMVACGGVLLSVGQSAMAQATQSLERVEITGSNIKRSDTETASPVQVISKQELDQAGKGTVAEFLQTLTADGQGSVPFTYGRGFSGATAAGISLRGLGANATLVLLNGRRLTSAVLADDAQRSYVDLNQIPLEMVDHIDVVKDGASAIYGSDAVAGVVNIILKKNFVGTVLKASYGTSYKGDGNEPRVAATTGFGDLTKDGYNVILNAEYGKKGSINYRDRMGRNAVGVTAFGQPQWGGDPNGGPNNNIARFGGNGWIPVDANGIRINNQDATNGSIVGNVRNPTTNDFYSRSDPTGVGFTRTFPIAATFCNANANLPQNNPAGGCITDTRQLFNQVQPSQESGSFSGRVTKTITPEIEGAVDFGYYGVSTNVAGIPYRPNGTYYTRDGIGHSQTAVTLLGAAHPDNPYFGTEARLAYSPLFDPGAANTETDSRSFAARLAASLKGTFMGYDFDAGFTWSEAQQTDVSTKVINWRVKNALLDPTAANVATATAFSPAYAALPAGTFWRIGENSGLNSQALYNALYANQSRDGFSRLYGADIKVSKEYGQLPGGPIGVAVGVEARRESNALPFYSGLGDFQGLSVTSYGGSRNIYATYAEVNLPVLKQLEVNGALRYDHYTDAGDSVTPKIGLKYKPISNLAIRGTYSKAFRAPSSSENSANAIAAFGGATVTDTIRCAAVTADPAATTAQKAQACQSTGPTFVQHGNPDLKPEKSTSFTLGVVFDITPKDSMTVDLWQIKRKGSPALEDPQAAVSAGRITRDPTNTLSPLDPGAILYGSVVFQNSAQTKTNGLDVEYKSRWNMGTLGGLTTGLTWTHLITQDRTTADGTLYQFAGNHGDCQITNCIGSPRDKVSIAGTYDFAPIRVGLNINYRGKMKAFDPQDGPGCSNVSATGADVPAGCKVKSFTTADLSAAWKFGKNSEVFGSIQNVLDAKPPVDFQTYGAYGYNPLDYSGAIGRFFRVGVKYQF